MLNKNETLTPDEIENIEIRIQTGLTICAFSYKHDVFLERLINICGMFFVVLVYVNSMFD